MSEETPHFPLVSELQGDGISASDISKLRDARFFTIREVAHASKRQIQQVPGISEKKAEKLIAFARDRCGDMGLTTAAIVLEARENLITITTGSPALDSLLGGGIETGSLTEIFGEYRTGKSQLCHTLAVTSQLPVEQHGAEGKCLYIDTEGTFRPERIRQIARRYGMDEVRVLENVAYAKAFNHEHLMEIISKGKELFSQTRFGIIIVDSVMALLRQEMAGRGELSARQAELNKCLAMLQQIGEAYGVAVVYTNQVTAQVDGMTPFGESKKAIGGHIMSHRSTTRLMFKKGRGERRVCRVIDSPCLPESECQFGIYSRGIDDVEDDPNE